MKTLETLCLSAGRSKPNLKTFVLCSGILYGKGEDTFFPLFKQAWLQSPENLPIIGRGINKIPTIHYDDLAMFVKYIIYKTPKSTNYIFAIDHTNNRKQRKLIRAISKGIGGGKISKLPVSDDLKKMRNYEYFVLDLWMRPSRIFEEVAEEGEENEQADEEPEDAEGEEETGVPKNKLKLKFDWKCKSGISVNIKD